MRSGFEKIYFESGNVKAVNQYRLDLKHGKHTSYLDGGKDPVRTCFYYKGKLHGKLKSLGGLFGNYEKLENYYHGLQHGEQSYGYGNNHRIIYNYYKGEFHGKQIIRNRCNIYHSLKRYDHGVLNGKREFQKKSSDPLESTTYLEGVKHGEYLLFDKKRGVALTRGMLNNNEKKKEYGNGVIKKESW